MAVNLSPLSQLTTTATALSNLVLVTPQKTVGYQPQNSFISNQTVVNSQPPLLFHYEGEQTVTLMSDITDHYIEDNTAIQDQIALKPEIVTTHGFIGELTDIAPPGFALAQFAKTKLTVLTAYTPELTTTGLIAYNIAFQAYQVAQNAIAAGVAAWATVTGAGTSVVGNQGLVQSPEITQTKQQRAFQQFYGYWRNRTLFTVQTPWAIFQNMAIQSLRAIQDADTRVITDFEISFKRIRLATTASVSNTQALILQGRLLNQAASVQNNGATPVVPSIRS